METLLAFDRFILERICEPCAQYMERMFGTNCFVLARACLLICAGGIAYAFSLVGFASLGLGTIIFVVVTLIGAMMIIYAIERDHVRRTERATGAVYRNAAKDPATSRLRICVALAMIANACLLLHMGGMSTELVISQHIRIFGYSLFPVIAAIYFIACDTLPPGTVSKVREFFMMLGRRPAVATVPVRHK